MKKLNRVLLWMAILPFLFLISCKDDDPAPNDSFSIMTEYMINNDLDLPNILDGWIIARPATEADIPAFLDAHYIMDLRLSEDFNQGHIEGAVNTTLASIVDDAANSGGKQILVVCYTGQTAAHATVALRLSGYKDAQVLKWGMSGWNSTLDHWTAGTGSAAKASGNWTMDGTADLTSYDYPTFTTTSTDGAEILAERVAYMTSKGFSGIASADVYTTPGNYHINNFWDQASIDKYGNIDGAYKINPLSLAGGEFKYYDPDAINVTYCWTGQTSSMVTAYLTVLGYDAKSLKFGVNSMIYDDLAEHKWAVPATDYPLSPQ